jgi:circadian clock protein KaiC
MSESELEIKKFIHELQVYAELVGCTTLLLTGESQTGQQYAFRTMVDGLIELHLDAAGMEASRSLEVTKFRGSTVLMGRHLFEITSAGLTIYPRTEAAFGRSPDRPDPRDTRPAAFGMEGLDMALGGGLRAGSTTMVLGMPGSGKTLLGLSWLAAGAAAQEQGLYFGFFETPSDLLRKAEGIGLPWGDAIASGRIEVVWEPPLGVIADRLAEKLLAAVSRRHVRRLFIDGLAGLSDALINTRRSRRFFSALCNELRSRGVATILSDETRSLREFEVDTSDEGLTAMLDNVISLRHVEIASRRSKLAAVLKTREKAGDETVHGYSIGPRGFTVSTARPDDRYVEELQREEKASPVAKKRSKRRRR